MAKKIQKTFLFLLIIINCNFIDNNDKTSFKQTGSEEILIEIMESYKDFSAQPEKAIETIWSHAHKDNKAVTGPIERFGVMLTSEPYNAIINLTDYSFEVLQEDDQTIQYEIKILNNKNEYFIVNWIFTLDKCEMNEGLCWQTISVSPPMYFDSGI